MTFGQSNDGRQHEVPAAELEHVHPVSPERVARAQQILGVDEAERMAVLLRLIGDGVRMRVLLALEEVDTLCVGDIALALGISHDSASYALRQLRAAGLIASRKAGRTIWYRLAEGFPHVLLNSCVHALLGLRPDLGE